MVVATFALLNSCVLGFMSLIANKTIRVEPSRATDTKCQTKTAAELLCLCISLSLRSAFRLLHAIEHYKMKTIHKSSIIVLAWHTVCEM